MYSIIFISAVFVVIVASIVGSVLALVFYGMLGLFVWLILLGVVMVAGLVTTDGPKYRR